MNRRLEQHIPPKQFLVKLLAPHGEQLDVRHARDPAQCLKKAIEMLEFQKGLEVGCTLTVLVNPVFAAPTTAEA